MRKFLYICLPFLIATTLLLVSPSCTRTVVKTITDTLLPAWQPLPIFNSTVMPALSSLNIGDSILLVGGNYAYSEMPVNHPTFNFAMTYPLLGAALRAPIQEAPFLNGVACSYTNMNSLYVESIPVYSQYSYLVYTPVFTPGTYSVFQTPSPFPWQCSTGATYPLIRSKYLLTPVETMDATFQQIRFDLLSFDSAKVLSPFGFGDSPIVKRIILSPAPGTFGFSGSGYFCATYYDKFFCLLR